MAALLLARLDQTPDDLKRAVELALAGLQHIVSKTYEASNSQTSSDNKSPEVRPLILKSPRVGSLNTKQTCFLCLVDKAILHKTLQITSGQEEVRLALVQSFVFTLELPVLSSCLIFMFLISGNLKRRIHSKLP